MSLIVLIVATSNTNTSRKERGGMTLSGCDCSASQFCSIFYLLGTKYTHNSKYYGTDITFDVTCM